jgi:hypothetical protein
MPVTDRIPAAAIMVNLASFMTLISPVPDFDTVYRDVVSLYRQEARVPSMIFDEGRRSCNITVTNPSRLPLS